MLGCLLCLFLSCVHLTDWVIDWLIFLESFSQVTCLFTQCFFFFFFFFSCCWKPIRCFPNAPLNYLRIYELSWVFQFCFCFKCFSDIDLFQGSWKSRKQKLESCISLFRADTTWSSERNFALLVYSFARRQSSECPVHCHIPVSLKSFFWQTLTKMSWLPGVYNSFV